MRRGCCTERLLSPLIARPQAWPWVAGVVVADHLALTAASLWPRSTLLGSNWTRLPQGAETARAVAITVDDGPDPIVTPQVLKILARHSARATFFCIGERVERYPQLAREIRSAGHAIENHTQHHLLRFSLLGPRGMTAEIERAQEAIASISGELPRFFRAPAGLRNPFLEPILQRHGLQLASWTRRGFDTVNPDSTRVLRKLTRRLRGRDILLLHDGHAARTKGGTPVILEVLPQLLEVVKSAGLTPVTLRAAQSGGSLV